MENRLFEMVLSLVSTVILGCKETHTMIIDRYQANEGKWPEYLKIQNKDQSDFE